MNAKADKEIKKEMILECLKWEIELKKLEKSLRVKRKKNVQMEQQNKIMFDFFNGIKIPFENYQYQDAVNVKNCSIKLMDVEMTQKERVEKKKKKTNDSDKAKFLFQNGEFVCEHLGCRKRFKIKPIFMNHRRIHTTKFQCHICQKYCVSPSSLQAHLRIHTNERPFKCDWIGCGSSFKMKRTLKQHIASKHLSERPFHCNENGCCKSFKTKSDLKSHLICHSSLRLFQCPMKGCGVRVKKKRNIKQHIQKRHSNEKPFQCQMEGCEKKFKSNGSLKKHLKHTHSEVREFHCDFENCKKSFKTRWNLQQHRIRKNH